MAGKLSMNEEREGGVALACGCRFMKYEIRMTKHEGNPNDEGNPKSESQLQKSGGLQFPRPVPPHPFPLPQGEGEPRTAVEQLRAAPVFECAADDTPSPGGRGKG